MTKNVESKKSTNNKWNWLCLLCNNEYSFRNDAKETKTRDGRLVYCCQNDGSPLVPVVNPIYVAPIAGPSPFAIDADLLSKNDLYVLGKLEQLKRVLDHIKQGHIVLGQDINGVFGRLEWIRRFIINPDHAHKKIEQSQEFARRGLKHGRSRAFMAKVRSDLGQLYAELGNLYFNVKHTKEYRDECHLDNEIQRVLDEIESKEAEIKNESEASSGP